MGRCKIKLDKCVAVLNALKGRRLSTKDMAEVLGVSYEVARQRLVFLHRLGSIERRGGWGGIWLAKHMREEKMPKLGPTIGADGWAIGTEYQAVHGVILEIYPNNAGVDDPDKARLDLTGPQARQLARHLIAMAEDVEFFGGKGK